MLETPDEPAKPWRRRLRCHVGDALERGVDRWRVLGLVHAHARDRCEQIIERLGEIVWCTLLA